MAREPEAGTRLVSTGARILITGGAGFIGSAAVRYAIALGHHVLNLDALTYAGDLETVRAVESAAGYAFEQLDITDRVALAASVERFAPDIILHFAAETHVDRSIDQPNQFVATNVVGTANLLDAALAYYDGLTAERQAGFRLVHISTDEVFGSLSDEGRFDETTPYDPSSPYSASKAASDHLCRAWHRTYGLPVLITNCSNNFGPYQHPEKLIPTVVRTALAGVEIPLYGSGSNVRDWLYVEDHVAAIFEVLNAGTPGETYCIGGGNEKSNLQMVTAICEILDEQCAAPAGGFSSQITSVEDRPGHDYRYAIDNAKLIAATDWSPSASFAERLQETVRWFVNHPGWLEKSSGRLGLRNTANQEMV